MQLLQEMHGILPPPFYWASLKNETVDEVLIKDDEIPLAEFFDRCLLLITG